MRLVRLWFPLDLSYKYKSKIDWIQTTRNRGKKLLFLS